MYTNEQFFPVESSILSGEAILECLQKQYGENMQYCRLYYRSIHDTYIVRGSKHTYFFKVYRFGLRTKEDIQNEISAIEHLLEYNIVVTKPVQTQDGRYIIEFNTIQGIRYGVLYTSVGEKMLNEENDEINERLGEYLGTVHRAWDEYPLAENHRKLDVEYIIDDSMEHVYTLSELYDFDLDFLQAVSDKLKMKLSSLSRNGSAYGMCHGDFYSGNIRISPSGEPVLFDFDFSGVCWRMYDVALYANAFGLGCSKDDIVKRERRKAAFMNGYSRVQNVSEEMIQSMDLFVPYRRIFNIGTIYCGMTNTFGDHFAINNTNRDIEMLKKWLELNPVL